MADRKKVNPRKDLVAVATALPADIPTPTEPPPLGAAQLHVMLDRANVRHLELTDELPKLKASGAKRNVEASQCRESIPAAEIKHVETQRRNLQSGLMVIQTEISRLNKSIRERKASRAANNRTGQMNHEGRSTPLVRDDPDPVYFVLAAKSELDAETYDRIAYVARALRRDARRMGVD